MARFPTGSATRPTFERLPQQRAIQVRDPVQDVQFRLLTERPVEPQPCVTDAAPWCFPIDASARLATSTVTVPIRLNVNIREPDGRLVESIAEKSPGSADEARFYTVELAGTPIKLYLAANSRVLVTPDDYSTEIHFPDTDVVYLGARSLHELPARTLTTTTDPRDLMEVISEFGAALKTTSCERSWPTLRGHPPLLEFGDRVHIPGGRQRVETGVRIDVPPEPEYIFPVAPLVYYTSAKLRPGERPRLVTDRGFSFDLTSQGGFERTVAEVLQHVFTLDCLTRCEGYYPITLHERLEAASVPSLDLDFEALYDAPLAEQLAVYLQIPFEDVAPLRPEWRLTADMPSATEHADILPHFVEELALVRCYPPELEGMRYDPETAVPETEAGLTTTVDDFFREDREATEPDGGYRVPGPSEPGGGRMPVSQEGVFRVREASTTTQTYVGSGFPVGGNKASKRSYERQLHLRQSRGNQISVTVVCNDPEMTEEIGVGEYYGTRDLFDFDVTIEQETSVALLREVFESDVDLVHYIGHVDSRGLQCADGYLSTDSISSVGVSAFILNGCRSFRQGAELVESGAIGGIVTLENVHNSLATEVGHNIARLLNAGWTLDTALKLVREDSLVGRHYLVVGDGTTEIANPDSGTPSYLLLEPTSHETVDVTQVAFLTRSHHLGTITNPFISDSDTRYLAGGKIGPFEVTVRELKKFLSLASFPVQLEEELQKTTISLQWSDDFDVSTLFE
ncbi:hypothetical protein [Natronomonas sp. EA1]|uniref:hypothetical protein n=1 Tax=Natronomonas sp. EA1 TaxID=3421655 RepID=UPI003EBEE137